MRLPGSGIGELALVALVVLVALVALVALVVLVVLVALVALPVSKIAPLSAVAISQGPAPFFPQPVAVSRNPTI